MGQHGLKKDAGKGSVCRSNVCLRLLVLRVHHVDRGATVVVNACGVVGHVGYLGQKLRKGVRVRFCGEKKVDITRSCTEEQVHSCGGWRSLCLGIAAEVKK